MVKPFLKWVGGKRQLIKIIKDLLPDDYEERVHIEPFVGGGAVVLSLQPRRAFISDYNEDLIDTYHCIAEYYDRVFDIVFSMKNTKEDYYKYRDKYNQRMNGTSKALTEEEKIQETIEKSALFIYLNRTGFNGMYRVNQYGKLNVPWGHNPHEDMTSFFNLDTIRETSEYLWKHAQIKKGSYVTIIDSLICHDNEKQFWYLDPPYAPLDKDIERGNFTAYTTFPGWDLKEQVMLRAKCEEIDKAGQKFMLSNSSCTLVKELYKKFNLQEVDAKRMISAKKETRDGCKEVIVTNY